MKYMFNKNLRWQDFNCFIVSDLQTIVYNNDSYALCFLFDNCNFSEQFLLYHDLTALVLKSCFLVSGG